MDKKEVAGKVISVGGGLLSRLGRLMPRGGVRDPNSLVRNKSLYVGNGNFPSPLANGRVLSGKGLLTGCSPRKKVRRRKY